MFCLALSCLTLSRLTLSCLGAPERSPEHDIVTNRPTAASRKLAKGASAPRQIATEIRRRGTPPGLPGDSPEPPGQATSARPASASQATVSSKALPKAARISSISRSLMIIGGQQAQIGRAHVRTPVNNATLVFRSLLV